MGLKRKKVVISRKAQKSIREIYDYIQRKSSKEVATRVKDSIIDRCKNLADFAGYSKETFLEGDYRSVSQWDYSIIYSETDTMIRVLLVIHGSRHPDMRKTGVNEE